MTAERPGRGAELHVLRENDLYQAVRGRVFETYIQPPLAAGQSESPVELLVDAYKSGGEQFQRPFQATCLRLLQEIGDKRTLEDPDQTALANLGAIGVSLGTPSLSGEFRRFVLRGSVQGEISLAPNTEEWLLGALINTAPQKQPLDPIWQRLWEDPKPVRYAAAFTAAREQRLPYATTLIPELLIREPQPTPTRLRDMIFRWWEEHNGDHNAFAGSMHSLPPEVKVVVKRLLDESEMSEGEKQALPRIDQEPQESDVGYAQRMRLDLRKWIEAGADPQQLTNWLQGNNLPPGEAASTYEPPEQILMGIPWGLKGIATRSALAKAAVSILGSQPDAQSTARPARLIDSLLMLCANLGPRDELSEQLHAMYQRRALHGKWRGVELRDSLLIALTRNQVDSRLQGVWEAMLNGTKQDYFSGNPYDGFYGILLMPESPDKRGKPFIKAIGQALSQMAQYLEDNPTRDSYFRNLIDRVAKAYPTVCLRLESDLLAQAQQHKWPQWAIECLSAKA